MDYFKVAPQLRVFILKCLVAVGGGNDNFPHPVFNKGNNVTSGQALEQTLVACFANAFPAAVFLGSEDAKIGSGFLQDTSCSSGYAADHRVVGGGAAGEV